MECWVHSKPTSEIQRLQTSPLSPGGGPIPREDGSPCNTNKSKDVPSAGQNDINYFSCGRGNVRRFGRCCGRGPTCFMGKPLEPSQTVRKHIRNDTEL
ncbi:hypothetical protein GDO81_021891 [Engystomops pustulosus]|uniref:Uncharacterized protein n=1 Tax=Engystomops pustulosus TaxID=76066 RepID=A0AAV6YVA8_ENGPU|nr:hypothetical protein GDO81_021891 [Engystomops pustulosus]